MKKVLKVISSMTVVSALALGGVIVLADTVNVDGGTWVYGYNHPVNAYSKFIHPRDNHGARVINKNNGTISTDNQRGGVWAQGIIGDLWDPASFYYSPHKYYSD